MLNDVVSKFGRSLVSQFGRHVIKITMYVIDIPSKLRPNFDTALRCAALRCAALHYTTLHYTRTYLDVEIVV